MSKFEFVKSETEDWFDILVQVGFEKPLESTDIVQVLQIIVDTITSKVALNIFEGLASLEVDSNSLTIRFRYSRSNKSDPTPYDSEDLARLRSQFIFYLFAKIDLQYKLADIPFPPNFRNFLSLPDYL